MNAALPQTVTPSPQGSYRTSGLKVIVRALRLDIEIGIYDHEHGRLQPLVIDVELEVLPDLGLTGFSDIHDTVNYEGVVAKAKAVAKAGHILLVEAFAQRLAQACLDDRRVVRAKVYVEKPQALAPDAAAAAVEIIVERT